MNRPMLIISTIALLTGCAGIEETFSTTPPSPSNGASDYAGDSTDGSPGTNGWPGTDGWAEETVGCEEQSDCNIGESCLNSVCQPSQCDGGLALSQAPIGSTYTFFEDNEIGIVDKSKAEGSYWIDSYAPFSTTTDYESSIEFSDAQLVDISGGRFTKNQKKAEYVAAIDGRTSLGFTTSHGGSGSTDWISLGYEPAALDAGDTDADGLDEVIVVSEEGSISNCHMDSKTCERWNFSEGDTDLSLIDVAAGDIDGDSVDEIIALVDVDGSPLVYVLNQDYEDKNQPQTYQAYVEDAIRLDVGDLNGDKVDEIAVLRDIGSLNPFDSEFDIIEVLNVIAPVSSDSDVGDLTTLAGIEATGLENLEDIEIADTDADTQSEIFVVDSEEGLLVAFDLEETTLRPRFEEELAVNLDPYRIALSDTDGDSPQATLTSGGPTLAKGAPIPSAMILMPPYDQRHSASPSSSFYGASESTSETYSDTISLGMKVDVGVKVEFLDMFGASFGTSLSWRVRQTYGEGFRTSVGERFGMKADPEMYGPHHGAVVLYWGCFDTYTYEIDDPNGLVSNMDGENFVLTVPVGGSSSVWSLSRYNAMAEALGTLPILKVPYTVGDVDDYPRTPERIDGTPIPQEDMVFKDPTWYTAPDVGSIAYRSSFSNEVSNWTSWSTTLGTSAGITVAGMNVGVGSEYGFGESYRLALGESAMFSGSVSAVPDDPETPEDEYEMYTFRFVPVVYRHWYTNPMGEDAALFVMTYAAER